MKKFGYDTLEWDVAKEEIRQILIQRARSSSPTITYSDLVREVDSIRLEPDSHALRTMLGEISTEEDSSGRGMLTVLVVHKGDDLMPGGGFFELARQLKRDVDDHESFWVEEFKRVTTHWRTH